MKLFKLLVFAIIPILFFSCNPDADRFQPVQNTGIIDANINGYAWSATSGYAAYENFTLQLYGTGPNGSALTITIYPYNGIGTYSANSPADIYFQDVDGVAYDAITGTVNINSDNNGQVNGNFNFSAVASGGSTAIDMSGSFNLYY